MGTPAQVDVQVGVEGLEGGSGGADRQARSVLDVHGNVGPGQWIAGDRVPGERVRRVAVRGEPQLAAHLPSAAQLRLAFEHDLAFRRAAVAEVAIAPDAFQPAAERELLQQLALGPVEGDAVERVGVHDVRARHEARVALEVRCRCRWPGS